MKQLLGALRERSEVLGGGSEFDQLSRTVGEMEAVIPLLVKAMKAAVLEPSDANTAARDGHIRGQASCFQVVMQVLQNTYQASGAFDYTSLAESMAELEKAVQAGDREAATCQAKDIAQALRVCFFVLFCFVLLCFVLFCFVLLPFCLFLIYPQSPSFFLFLFFFLPFMVLISPL